MSAAVAPPRPAVGGARGLELVMFVAALTTGGLVVFALLWSGTAPYADLARDNDAIGMTFIDRSGRQVSWDLAGVIDVHRRWTAYVTGGTSEPPTFAADIRFTADEYAHMADVRRVFDGAKLLVPLSLVVITVRLWRARSRDPRAMWSLVRTGSATAAVLVALVGVFAVVAFEPLFLAFHYVFFPQGNFLFDPAESNLVRLYPDWYWEGIAIRVGVSFAALALGLSLAASLRLARAK